MTKRVVGFDVETTSKDPITADLVSIQIYNPLTDSVKRITDPLLFNEALAELEANYKVIGHMLYFDLLVAKKRGFSIQPAGDSFLMFNMCPAAGEQPKDSRSLKDLSDKYLGGTMIRFNEVCPTGNFGDCDLTDPKVIEYMDQDPRQAYKLFEYLAKEYPQILESHYDEMEFLPDFVNLTFDGIEMDPDKLAQLTPMMKQELALLERELFEELGFEFNPNSATPMPAVS